MIAPFAILAFAFTIQQPPASNPCAAGYTQNVWDPRFTPGQRWSYHTRPLDKDSTLTITKIDYVPDIGFVVHIEVDHVDFDDIPGDRPHNNHRREYFAIRRDSLDASALEILGISQVVGPPLFNYHLWQANCAGLTYGTTVADTLKTLNDQYLANLARQETFTTQFALARNPSDKPEKFTLTLSQRIIRESFSLRELQGRVSFKDGSPVKDAHVEIKGHDTSQRAYILRTKIVSEGTFPVGSISLGTYDFQLTLDGFPPIVGTLHVSSRQSSLANLRSSN